MAEHDYNLANATGANFRSDANGALSAIVSLNSKATEPSTTFAFMIWADTTAGILKQRNAANSAWINLWTITDGPDSGIITTSLIESGDVTTTSTTFVTTGLAITQTLKAGKQHLVTFAFSSANSTSTGNTNFDIYDGTNYASSGTSTPETNGIIGVNQPSATNDIPVRVDGRFTGLGAGSTTFTLYFKVEDVAHIAKIKANSAGPKVVASIIELS